MKENAIKFIQEMNEAVIAALPLCEEARANQLEVSIETSIGKRPEFQVVIWSMVGGSSKCLVYLPVYWEHYNSAAERASAVQRVIEAARKKINENGIDVRRKNLIAERVKIDAQLAALAEGHAKENAEG